MEKYKVAIMLLWAFFVAGAISLSETEIEAKLKLHNRPAVKTIKCKNGDIIDCVDIYKQPAFDHPALKNHTIQKIPTFLKKSQHSSIKYTSKNNFKLSQTWHKSGRCPKGTVPIRRIQKQDLLRAASLDRFGLKQSSSFVNSKNTTISNFSKLSGSSIVVSEDHSGVHLATSGSNFIGAEADINVWNPKVDLPDDSTTAQIWLKAGNGNEFESIEAGWMVNPGLYGNHDTRLFSYWTTDSYKSTGCFDLTCSGFVQTSNRVALGGGINPISSDSGTQYELNIGIYLDELGHWWLKENHDIPIGYWPVELFTSLKHSATLVQWGGQVFSSKVKKSPHTKTQMGSGHLADEKYGHACYMRNIRIKDNSLMLKYPESINVASQEPNCYSAFNDEDVQEPTFYFGGPGQSSPSCP